MTNAATGRTGTTLMLVVAAALIDDAGRVLMQQRPEGKPLAGLWEFPGGKIESGERPEEALVRELSEELGIVVATLALEPAGFASEPLGARHLVLLLFRCRVWEGLPRGLDRQELRWCAPADLRALPMPPADRALLTMLAAAPAEEGGGL